jgi:hypothetical protein
MLHKRISLGRAYIELRHNSIVLRTSVMYRFTYIVN